jgi:hypothetical protein
MRRARAGRRAASTPDERTLMPDANAAFIGSIPVHYDRHLGSVFFHPYADDLVARLRIAPGMRVERAVARNVAAVLGDHPVRVPLRAIVFTARRPAR